MSGFITWLHSPLMWVSKHQTFTARSSAKAEIYAADKCAKNILHILHIISNLGLTKDIISGPVKIWNDNRACVCWSKNTTTKGLRHVQIRENAVREGVSMGLFNIEHIEGKYNPSDIFTKEDKDISHFLQVRNSVMNDTLGASINETKVMEITPQTDQSTGGGVKLGVLPPLPVVLTNYLSINERLK